MTVDQLQLEERTTAEASNTSLQSTIDRVKTTALRGDHLIKNYGRRRVVDDVSLQVERGEVVGLLGANGAGKTTTFYMIVGLERPDGGRVLLGDQDLTKLPMYLRARLGIGYLPVSYTHLTLPTSDLV